ncbi:MAG TPA: tectonin domain-containing protein [Mucilaginibacter sp.]
MGKHFCLLFLIFGVGFFIGCKKEKPVEPSPAIELSTDTLKVLTGGTIQFTTKNYTVDQLILASSDTTIFKINTAGLVTGYKKGRAAITIKSKAHGALAVCGVIVQEANILSVGSLTMPAASSKQLTGQNYVQSEFVWSSSDTTVATISSSGLIEALKPGSITITVKTKTYSVSNALNLTVTNAKLTDVGVGADGSVYVVGSDSVNSAGDNSIFKFYNSQFHRVPNGSGVRIAVSPQGVPWIVNQSNQVFKYSGGTWTQVQGLATDIGISSNGSIFAIGTQVVTTTGGFDIMKWNGSGWDVMPESAGINITVDRTGTPWVANKSNIVFQYGGTLLWNPIYGVSANDIAAGGDGSIYVSGMDTSLPNIYKYNGGGWSQVAGLSNAMRLSADANGKIWYIDTSGVLHQPN